MTDSKRLYQSWQGIRKNPKYYCEHKKLIDDLTGIVIEEDGCRPCDGYDVNCKYYRLKNKKLKLYS